MLASCDFQNELTGEVSVPSTWKQVTTVQDAETQTSKLKVKEREAQTASSSIQSAEQLDKGVGTERPAYTATLQGLQYVYKDVEHDEAKLAAFLGGCKDEVMSILYRNARSNVFSKYSPNWSSKSTELSVVHTLSSPHAVEGGLHALSVSWNAHGTMVAVAYGRIDISGWCYEKGYVCVWNLALPDLDENTPHYTIETDTFATCVSFHPTISTMLAVGTYSGEVLLLPNVTDSVPTEHSSSASGVQSQEPVTTLQWEYNMRELRAEHQYVLCSSDQRGQIAYWNVAGQLAKALAVYTVQSRRHLPAGVVSLTHGHGPKGSAAGTFSSLDSVLLVGLENGDVGRGRIGPLVSESETVTTLEMDWVEGHRGPVQAIAASPFFRHLFITCSSDGTANLYSDLERTPLLTLEPSAETKHFLYDAQFSPFRPCVLALVSRSSFLHLYDLEEEQSKPVFSVEAGVNGAAVLSFSFNHAAADWVATGDTRGCIRVWRLPSHLSQPTDKERVALRTSARVDGKTDGKKESATEQDAMRELLGFAA